MSILNDLLTMQDTGYKEFQQKLMPTVDKDKVIGVRTPQLRKYAKRIAGTDEADSFLHSLPHNNYEENNLHAFLIEQERDFDKALELTKEFLPYIDNWATCDSFLPPVFKKNKEKLLQAVREWINDDGTYTVRYAIGLLLKLWLDEDFDREYAEMVSGVRSEEYYVNMMIAWYYATALAKQYNIAIEYIKERRLSALTHNKAIQKAIESYRIDKDTKKYLKTLKI